MTPEPLQQRALQDEARAGREGATMFWQEVREAARESRHPKPQTLKPKSYMQYHTKYYIKYFI